MNLHLEHTDILIHCGFVVREPTIRISTISIPNCTWPEASAMYETCMFIGKDSEVIQTYDNAYDARAGHFGHCRKLGLIK